MAGGQSITSGQGTVTPSGASAGATLSGGASASAAGSAASAALVGLKSRKVGGGSASRAIGGAASAVGLGLLGPLKAPAISGVAAALAQGQFAKPRTLALTGQAASSATGPLTVTPQGAVITYFDLATPAVAGTYPFTVGQFFPQGAVMPGNIACNASTYQVVVKRTWRDGSAKFALISGRVALAQSTNSPAFDGSPTRISITSGTTQTGPALTSASIQAAAPTAVVDCGAFGSVSLSSLLATPSDTFASGHEMVECRYKARVGTSLILAIFDVRLYAGGRVHVIVSVDNGYLDATSSDRAFVPTVTIGGVQVFTNGGASLSTWKNCGWTAEGWIGGDPQITPKHNATYLKTAKAVPNYGMAGAPTTQGLTQWFRAGAWTNFATAYTPMMQGDADSDMGQEGYGPFIGPLPLWNSLYITSGGDYRALRTTLINAKAIRGRPIVWRSSADDSIPTPAAFPGWTTRGNVGAGGGDDELINGAGHSWELHHAPLEAYLAYLLTGERRYLDTLAMQAATYYLYLSASNGSGLNRTFRQAQVRGTAWGLRTVGAFCAIAPDSDAVAAGYRAWFANGIDYWWSKTAGDGAASQLGYPYSVGYYGDGTQNLAVGPWMFHFWDGAMGMVWDIDPGLTDRTKEQAFRDYLYKGIVGILGANGTSGYCFNNAGAYNVTIANFAVNNFTPHYAAEFLTSWAAVQTATHGNTACATTLQGTFGSDPAEARTGYWGNLLPAIAYAVDHGAAGASAAYARLTSASNWSSVANSGFADTPLWGVVPRSASMPAWMATVVPSTMTWGQIPGTAFATAQASYSTPSPAGGAGKPGIFAWSAGAVWHKEIIHPAGGGHTDYPGNEVLRLDLGADAPAVVVDRPPSANSAIVENTMWYLDGTPTSRHSYDEIWPNHAARKIMFLGCGSGYGGSPANTFTVQAWNVDSKTYDPQGTHYEGTTAAGGWSHQTDLPGCQDPATDDVYFFIGNNVLIKYTMATGVYSARGGITWTIVGTSGKGASAIDTANSQMLVLSNDASKHRCYTNYASGTLVESVATMTGPHASAALGNLTLHYIPDLGHYIFFRFGADTNVYKITKTGATTFDVDILPIAGTPPSKTTLGGAGFYRRFFHMPELKLFGFYGGQTSDPCSVVRYG